MEELYGAYFWEKIAFIRPVLVAVMEVVLFQ